MFLRVPLHPPLALHPTLGTRLIRLSALGSSLRLEPLEEETLTTLRQLLMIQGTNLSAGMTTTATALPLQEEDLDLSLLHSFHRIHRRVHHLRHLQASRDHLSYACLDRIVRLRHHQTFHRLSEHRALTRDEAYDLLSWNRSISIENSSLRL